MLSLPIGVRVFVAREHVDMRKAFDGLVAVVIDKVDEDPQSGHVFAFFNRRRDRVKLLLWDGSGYWLLCKRLEHGRFKIFDKASAAAGHFELRAAELTLLLEGIDLRGSGRRLAHDEILKSSLRA